MSRLAETPDPPYHMVVFSSKRTETDDDGYAEMSDRMAELVADMDGYLGHESARGPDGFGITVSYWRDDAAVRRWKEHLEHQVAQGKGKAVWYAAYALRVGRVERASLREGPAINAES